MHILDPPISLKYKISTYPLFVDIQLSPDLLSELLSSKVMELTMSSLHLYSPDYFFLSGRLFESLLTELKKS